MDDILLSASSRQTLKQCIANQTAALLISAPSGYGKFTVAKALAASYLNLDVTKLETYPYYKVIAPEANDITIDQIRQLQQFLSLKTTGHGGVRRIVIIQDADTMNVQAQNALLKTLEEPPEDTVIILTCSQLDSLLPTIKSRAQHIPLTPPTHDDIMKYFQDQGFDAQEIRKNAAIAGGAMGLISSLLKAEDTATVRYIQIAKELLQAKPFERLVRVDELVKQKDDLSGALSALKRICQISLYGALTKQDKTAAKAWHKRLDVILDTEEALTKSANAELAMTNMFLNV